MAHIDTLKAFDELVTSGVPEKEARAQISVLEKSFDGVVTTKDLQVMESNLKYFFTWEIVTVTIVIVTLPKLVDFLSPLYKFSKR